MATTNSNKDYRKDQNLTGLSMPFFNSNIFFTQTFSNVKRQMCFDCQDQWLTDQSNYHSHPPGS